MAPEASPSSDDSLAHDMLIGAEAIAVFMFGNKRSKKKVFNFVEKKELPVFRLGRSLYARKSVLIAWISEQETAARRGGSRIA